MMVTWLLEKLLNTKDLAEVDLLQKAIKSTSAKG
jgi:hypothetical protein